MCVISRETAKSVTKLSLAFHLCGIVELAHLVTVVCDQLQQRERFS